MKFNSHNTHNNKEDNVKLEKCGYNACGAAAIFMVVIILICYFNYWHWYKSIVNNTIINNNTNMNVIHANNGSENRTGSLAILDYLLR